MFIHFLLAMLPIIWLIIVIKRIKDGRTCSLSDRFDHYSHWSTLWKQKIIDVLTGGLEGFAMGNLANLSGYRGSSVYLQLGRTYEKHGTY